ASVFEAEPIVTLRDRDASHREVAEVPTEVVRKIDRRADRNSCQIVKRIARRKVYSRSLEFARVSFVGAAVEVDDPTGPNVAQHCGARLSARAPGGEHHIGLSVKAGRGGE